MICDRLLYVGLAAKYGWALRDEQPRHGLLIFTKTAPEAFNDMQINVWTTTRTVATILTHPRKGRGVLYRRRVTAGAVGLIFKDPRAHGFNGYYPSARGMVPL